MEWIGLLSTKICRRQFHCGMVAEIHSRKIYLFGCGCYAIEGRTAVERGTFHNADIDIPVAFSTENILKCVSRTAEVKCGP